MRLLLITLLISGCSVHGDVLVQLGDGNADTLTNGAVEKTAILGEERLTEVCYAEIRNSSCKW